MVSIELIGNLGADLEMHVYNGKKFASMRVAQNSTVNGSKVTDWYEVTLNEPSVNLIKYLVKGQCVFVRGIPRYRIYDSAVNHCKMVGVTIMANEIQLVGAAPKVDETRQDPESEAEKVEPF